MNLKASDEDIALEKVYIIDIPNRVQAFVLHIHTHLNLRILCFLELDDKNVAFFHFQNYWQTVDMFLMHFFGPFSVS